MMLRLATLCTLLAGSAAFAQITLSRSDDPTATSYTFGADQCNATLTLNWSFTPSISACSQNPLELWSTAGTCQDQPGTGDTVYPDVPFLTFTTLRQGTFTVEIAELPGFKSITPTDGGTQLTCGDPGFEKEHTVCARYEYTLCGVATPSALKASLMLVYDTEPPAAPKITDSSPLDKGVRVNFTVGSDVTAVLLEVKSPTDVDFREIAETASANTSVMGTGLQNNVEYQVQLRAKDAAGNVSIPSQPPVLITPMLTYGFWGKYRDAGGTDPGGCSTGAGLMPLLLAAFALRRARQHPRRKSS